MPKRIRDVRYPCHRNRAAAGNRLRTKSLPTAQRGATREATRCSPGAVETWGRVRRTGGRGFGGVPCDCDPSRAHVAWLAILTDIPGMDAWKQWARLIRRDAHALYLAARDSRVPWYAKALAIVVAAYALSPIDLIPDFIPVLGYLDDLLLVPLGIAVVVKLIPSPIMAEHRATAEAALKRPVSRSAAAVIASVWILSIGTAAWFGCRVLTGS